MIREQHRTIVGFDLGDEYSQITFYNRRNEEPMTISTVPGSEKYLIPTCLFRVKGESEWYFGADALQLKKEKAEGYFFDGLVRLMDLQQPIELETESIPTAELIRAFIEGCLSLLSKTGTTTQISIMVTMQEMREPFISTLKKALTSLGISKNNIFLQDHMESFFYFMLNQKKSLWTYHVALFEYEKDTIVAYDFWADYQTKPAIVHIEKKGFLTLDEKLKRRVGESQWGAERTRRFLDLIETVWKNVPYSSVYLVGDEFLEEWMQPCTKVLCSKRRHGFVGRNLYTKGACYGAMQRVGESVIEGFLYDSRDMIHFNIGMNMIIRGKEGYYPTIIAGSNWYEAYHECEFILDDTNEVTFVAKEMTTGEVRHDTIVIEPIKNRANRTLRLRMTMRFLNTHMCQVRLEDQGFGGLYRSSGKVWEQIIDLQRGESV